MSDTVTLPVTGMHCAACQARVQRQLEKSQGVEDASVNLLLNNATVRFDPRITSPERLIEAVRETGYGAALPVPVVDPAAEEDARDKLAAMELRTIRRKSGLSLVLGVAAMVLPLPVPVVLAITVFVMVWAGRDYYVRAWRAFRHHSADMNTLIATGTGAAFLFSLFATVAPGFFLSRGVQPALYYEPVIVILALVMVGNALEARARRQTSTALRALTRLTPSIARIVRDGIEREVSVAELRTGDTVLARPGERLAVDGVVVEGTGAVDESMLTGESMPVEKRPGSGVIGGTMNGTGSFRYRATTLGDESVLARIVRVLRDAQGSRAPIQRLADRVSGVFVPVVISLAIATFVIWYLLAADAPAVRAFAAGIAVLIIACPCAMGLAVPTAIMVSTGRAAELGLLIKGGDALERAGRIDTIVLDKTGTVTEGKPALAEVVSAPGHPESGWLGLVVSLEAASEHPVAVAIREGGRERSLPISPVDEFRARPGYGVTGRIGGVRIAAGNQALMADLGVDVAPLREAALGLAALGNTPVYAAVDGSLAGVLGVADRVRPSAAAAIERLRRLGLEVIMVSGDHRDTTLAVARQLGIEHAVAEVLPEGKVAEITRLQALGRTVAMVGDGINDAPALAAADVGIAMGSGSDIAADAGDIVLMRSDPVAVAQAVALSRRTMRLMRQNLFWAFVYNVIGIPVAAGALYPAFGILLSPILASAAMALSSVSVVGNSLRLRRFAG